MKRFILANNISAGRLASRVLYVLVALVAVVFGLFYMVGFDLPYDEDPHFNAPFFTDLLIIFANTITVIALVVSVASALIWLRNARIRKTENGIPAYRIIYGSAGFTAVCMIVTFIAGSSEPIVINGMKFADSSWLRLSDMFISTMIVLLLVAMAMVGIGISGLGHRIKTGKKQDVQKK